MSNTQPWVMPQWMHRHLHFIKVKADKALTVQEVEDWYNAPALTVDSLIFKNEIVAQVQLLERLEQSRII